MKHSQLELSHIEQSQVRQSHRRSKRAARTSAYLKRFIANETGTIPQSGTVTARDKQGRERSAYIDTYDTRPTLRPID